MRVPMLIGSSRQVRHFQERAQLELIQQICFDFASLARTEISRTVCELLQWKRPNGGLKNRECRLLLETG